MKNKVILLLVMSWASAIFAMKYQDGQVILEKLDDYLHCHELNYSPKLCQNALERWVEGHRGDAFAAGKLTRSKMVHWAAVELFHQAISAQAFDCNDQDLILAVTSALEQPTSQSKLINQARTIAFEKCPKVLPPKLAMELSTSSTMYTNICKDLVKLDLLSGLKQKKCK